MDKEKFYDLDVLCENCGYKGSQDFIKGERRAAKLICPRCECVDLVPQNRSTYFDTYYAMRNFYRRPE